MANREDLHKAHRSGWSHYYETTTVQPQHFLPTSIPAATKKTSTPPEHDKDHGLGRPGATQPQGPLLPPVQEFMKATGLSDFDLAAQHVAYSASLGQSVQDAVRVYCEQLERHLDKKLEQQQPEAQPRPLSGSSPDHMAQQTVQTLSPPLPGNTKAESIVSHAHKLEEQQQLLEQKRQLEQQLQQKQHLLEEQQKRQQQQQLEYEDHIRKEQHKQFQYEQQLQQQRQKQLEYEQQLQEQQDKQQKAEQQLHDNQLEFKQQVRDQQRLQFEQQLYEQQQKQLEYERQLRQQQEQQLEYEQQVQEHQQMQLEYEEKLRQQVEHLQKEKQERQQQQQQQLLSLTYEEQLHQQNKFEYGKHLQQEHGDHVEYERKSQQTQLEEEQERKKQENFDHEQQRQQQATCTRQLAPQLLTSQSTTFDSTGARGAQHEQFQRHPDGTQAYAPPPLQIPTPGPYTSNDNASNSAITRGYVKPHVVAEMQKMHVPPIEDELVGHEQREAMPEGVQVLSNRPKGFLEGKESASKAEKKASLSSFSGKLWRYTGVSGGGIFGNKWQARHFVLSQSTLVYEKKEVSLRATYVVPELSEKAQNREFAFGVYRSEAIDAFTGAAGKVPSRGGSDSREQLLLLAAEDERSRSKWICALLSAAGRSGVLLRIGDDVHAIRLQCCFGDESVYADVGAVMLEDTKSSKKIQKCLVRQIDASEGLGSVGVKVGDELVSVNGIPVPGTLPASAVGKMFEACSRPLDMEFRRYRDIAIFEKLAAKAARVRSTDNEGTTLEELMRKSMDRGAALRAAIATKHELQPNGIGDELQLSVADEAKGALSLTSQDAPRAPPEVDCDQHRIDFVVNQVLTAVKVSARADEYFYGGTCDHSKVATTYKTALETLLAVKDDLTDPTGPARQALALVAPGVSLPDLFDHINTNVSKIHENFDTSSEPSSLHAQPSEEAQLSYGGSAAVGAITQQVEDFSLSEEKQQQHGIALFDYEPVDAWQIALRAGESVLVKGQHEGGWTEVCVPSADASERRGLVPLSYIQLT
mmetsp:Transcript_6331/g.19825  ORF Transcript_6331/g.19825 Transcript_6331/m.19825 type:complete len:1033 (+) Transcript_6331:93-3191(+)